MSQENVELVRRINDAFNRGDFDPSSRLADPPPEFEYVPDRIVGAMQRGPEGFRRVVEGFWDEFDDPHIELEQSSTWETGCSSRPPSVRVDGRAARRRAGDLFGP